MTNTKVSVVQKARYGVLLIPVAWLLFSIWAVINVAFPQYTYETQRTPPAGSEILNIIIYGLGTLWVLFKILRNIKNQLATSVELKSALAFLLGTTLMAVSTYFQPWHLLFYLGMAIFDIAPILMIVTLLQGKPFAMLMLYHKDVQIQRSS